MEIALSAVLILIQALAVSANVVPVGNSTQEDLKDGEKYLPVQVTWTPPTPFGHTTSYLVVTNPVLSYDNAKTYCESLSIYSFFASIETPDEFTYIQTQLLNLVGPGGLKFNRKAFWLAGTDLERGSTKGSGGQYWVYSGVKINPTFWNPDEPNDYPDGLGYESCVDMKQPAPEDNEPEIFGLNDETCSSLVSFICETKTYPRLTADTA